MRNLGNPSLSCQAVSLNDSTLSRTFLNLHGGSGELFYQTGKKYESYNFEIAVITELPSTANMKGLKVYSRSDR